MSHNSRADNAGSMPRISASGKFNKGGYMPPQPNKTDTSPSLSIPYFKKSRRHMNILGLSAYHHESAACLLYNGEIVAAVKEESLASLSIIISCGFEKSRSLV
jgi:hypothetical protein